MIPSSLCRAIRMSALCIIAVVLAGCATTAVRSVQSSYVTLEREARGTWRATWHLAEPAPALQFERESSFSRAEVFEVLTPGYAFARSGEHEVLRTEGAPSRTIAVRFPEFTRALEKDYTFFVRFTDGSVAIYTGHLLARPLTEGETEECTRCTVNRFRLVPAAGEAVVAGGGRARSSLEWVDHSRQGSYVYFGSIAPVESGAILSIVDPGFPEWMRKASETAIPSLFDLFSRRLEAPLTSRPTVFSSYTPGDQRSYSFKGGVVPGAVQLTAEGRSWETESEAGLLRYLRLLAHEAVHLWNGGLLQYPDAEHAWLHEGSADALAERALLEMGVIDERRFLALQSTALNDCLRGLGRRALTDAAKKGDFPLYYSCGNMIALLTETSLQRNGKAGDLFEFWGTLIRKTRATDSRSYDPDDYVATWREAGARAEDVALLRALVDKPADPATLTDALRTRGVSIETSPTPPESYVQSQGKTALLHLMKQDCRGNFGFNLTPGGFLLADALDCDTLRSGEVVRAIDGHDLSREGHRAAEAVHRACAASKEIALTVASANDPAVARDVTIRCGKALPVPLPYLAITGRPARPSDARK